MGWWTTAAWGGGVAALVASPLLLARARARGTEARAARWGGWLALPIAASLLAPETGVEIAVAWVLAALPLPALGWIWWHRQRRTVAGDRATPVRAATLSPGPRHRGRGGRAALRVCAALPLAGVAALLVAIELSRPAGTVSGGTLLALGLFIGLWASGALWAFSDPRPGRPAAALLIAGCVCALPLWLA